MISSLKGMANAGGGTAIKRRFPVAAGETIEKGDVVSIFNNQAYKNSSASPQSLQRFSPDSLYLPTRITAAAIHTINERFFLHVGTASQEIVVSLYENSPEGMVARRSHSIPFSDPEGLASVNFTALSSDRGVVVYRESNAESSYAAVVTFSSPEQFSVGSSAYLSVLTDTAPQIESVNATSFLIAWYCNKAAPQRMKAAVFSITGANFSELVKGEELSVDQGSYIERRFAFNKVGEGRFVLTYYHSNLVSVLLKVSGTTVVLGGKATHNSALHTLRQVVLHANKYVISAVHHSERRMFLMTFSGDTPVVSDVLIINGDREQLESSEGLFDMIRVSDDRFLAAYRPFNPTGLQPAPGFVATYNTAGNKFSQVCIAEFSQFVSAANRLRILSVGSNLYVVVFNFKYNDHYHYTQAVMVRMDTVMTQFDPLSLKEQLINIDEEGGFAEGVFFAPIGNTGRWMAACRNRIKTFRCGWGTTKFIDAGLGEFLAGSRDRGVHGELVKALVLTGGDIVIAYREKDTWHGKMSAFRQENGRLVPLFSHTFSYSHVDNLQLLELAPGKILLQYRQRKVPYYDEKQYLDGAEHAELKLMTAVVTENGLANKKTGDFDTNDPYQKSYLFPLNDKADAVRILATGLDSHLNAFAQVFRFTEEPVPAMVSLSNHFILDNERSNIDVMRAGDNLFAVLDYELYLFEVTETNSIIVQRRSFFHNYRLRFGIVPWEQNEGFFLSKSTKSPDFLCVTKVAYVDDSFSQSGKDMIRSEVKLNNPLQFQKWGNRLAVLYEDSTYSSTIDNKPPQNVKVALLACEDENVSGLDRIHSFPGSANCPLLVPISDRHAFAIGADGCHNLVVTMAYMDEEHLAFGRPFLTPAGVASSSGSGGEYIEVVQSGIANLYEGLATGSAYYTDHKGALSTKVGLRKVGVAISEKELYVNGLLGEH